MAFNSKLLDVFNQITQKNHKNAPFDWFVMGFLFSQPNNTKSLEELFSTVNNITFLSRENSLSVSDTNDILIRMMNNAANSDKNKDSQKGSNGLLFTGSGSKEVQSAKKANGEVQKISKSSTIELDKDDMSYKSDEDLSPTKDTPAKNKSLKDRDFEDLLEFENLSDNQPSGKSNYVRKPIELVNVEDLLQPKNLKRLPTSDEEKLTLELIKQLEEEDKQMQKSLDDRKKKEEKQLADVICSICLGSLLDEAFIPLEGCVHMFHEGCFAEFLKSEINSRHFPIKCPSNCGEEVSQADMVQVLDKDLVSKFYDYSLQKYVSTHADEISCCPTANCTYAFVQDDGEDDNILNCPLCKKKYCLNCRADFHKGMTCKEYQISNKRDENDIKFEKFVKGKKYKQCSKCKFWVEKNQGCDHMTCRCKYEFCYKCGGKFRECECVKKMQQIAQQRAQTAKNKRRKR